MFFGLRFGPDGITFDQGGTLADLEEITSLEESLLQSDRYLALGDM